VSIFCYFNAPLKLYLRGLSEVLIFLYFQVGLLKTLMTHTVMTLTMKGKTLYGLAVEKRKAPKEVVVGQRGDSKAVEVAEAFKTRGSQVDVRRQQATKGKGLGTNGSSRGQPSRCRTQGRGQTPSVCFTCKGNVRRCVFVFEHDA
jgi:hypothetical protein